MNLCRKTTDLLPLFINGGLTQEEQNLVENHISECSECRIQAKEYEKLSSICKQEKYNLTTSYGSELIVKINNRLEKEQRKRKVLFTSIPISATVLTVFLITFFTIFKTGEFQDFDTLFSEDSELISELTNTSLFSNDYVYYSNEAEEIEDLYSDDYINYSTEYILENSTTTSDDYSQVLANLDDDSFEEIMNEMKSQKL